MSSETKGAFVIAIVVIIGLGFVLWSMTHDHHAALERALKREDRIDAECIRLGGHISQNHAMCLTADNRILDFPLPQ